MAGTTRSGKERMPVSLRDKTAVITWGGVDDRSNEMCFIVGLDSKCVQLIHGLAMTARARVESGSWNFTSWALLFLLFRQVLLVSKYGKTKYLLGDGLPGGSMNGSHDIWPLAADDPRKREILRQ